MPRFTDSKSYLAIGIGRDLQRHRKSARDDANSLLFSPSVHTGLSKEILARLCELAPSSVVSSHNLADGFLDNPVYSGGAAQGGNVAQLRKELRRRNTQHATQFLKHNLRDLTLRPQYFRSSTFLDRLGKLASHFEFTAHVMTGHVSTF